MYCFPGRRPVRPPIELDEATKREIVAALTGTDPALAALDRARRVRYLLVPAGAIPDPRWRAWCRDVGLPCVRAVVAEGRVAADWMHLAWRAGDLDMRRLAVAVLREAAWTAPRVAWPDRSCVLIDDLDPGAVEAVAWHLAEWLGTRIEAAEEGGQP